MILIITLGDSSSQTKSRPEASPGQKEVILIGGAYSL